MPNRGKKYLDSRKKVDRQKRHNFFEAVQMAIDASYVKFDETVDIAVRLGVDPRHADQMIRGTVVLPTGKGLTVGAWPGGGIGQTWLSAATAAGMPPMSTVGAPGPTMVPPWVEMSPTLAAAGIRFSLSYLKPLFPSSRAEHRKKQAEKPFKLFEAPVLWGPSS